MDGHINIDELNILNQVIIKIPKPLESAVGEIEKKFMEDQSQRLQNWTNIFDKNNRVITNK